MGGGFGGGHMGGGFGGGHLGGFGGGRALAFDIPRASHLNWRAKRPLIQAALINLDAALCGIKVDSTNPHLPLEFEFNVLNANLIARLRTMLIIQ